MNAITQQAARIEAEHIERIMHQLDVKELTIMDEPVINLIQEIDWGLVRDALKAFGAA